MPYNMRSSSSCVSVLLIVSLMLLSLSADAYKNYTVGGSTGWFDIQERPSANYQKWADSKTFSLGDFLSKFTPDFISVLLVCKAIVF